jgi:predicted PurR-regulated permease PerM
MITQGVGTFVSGAIWLTMQLFITLMTLFFFFRDHHHGLRAARSMMPLSDSETNEVFQRVDDTIHATIYGSVVVGLVQGAMGGLMFWMLGLPSPLTWGAIMGMLAVVPVLGTFVIWAPTAMYLALEGDWTRALILATWGCLAIGLIDNLLNPFLVGKRMRFHTLLVFFSILGGLAFFGASGLILGPLILALADALIDVWRRRTAYGGTLEKSVERVSAPSIR